jgi:hypothetical protein
VINYLLLAETLIPYIVGGVVTLVVGLIICCVTFLLGIWQFRYFRDKKRFTCDAYYCIKGTITEFTYAVRHVGNVPAKAVNMHFSCNPRNRIYKPCCIKVAKKLMTKRIKGATNETCTSYDATWEYINNGEVFQLEVEIANCRFPCDAKLEIGGFGVVAQPSELVIQCDDN